MIVSFSDLWFPKRDYRTQSILKKRRKPEKKSENEYFPAGQNISELVLYLQRITKHKRATKQDADISAQCLTPRAVGLWFPICKIGIEIRPLSLTIKAICFFPCIYTAHWTSSPLQCYDDTNFYGKNKTKQTLHLETNISEVLKYHDLGLEIL